MNERITELADKAVEDMPSGPWNIPDEFCKKFAELIVRECVETLRLVPYNSDREFGDEAIYQEAIKEHFGVEE